MAPHRDPRPTASDCMLWEGRGGCRREGGGEWGEFGRGKRGEGSGENLGGEKRGEEGIGERGSEEYE